MIKQMQNKNCNTSLHSNLQQMFCLREMLNSYFHYDSLIYTIAFDSVILSIHKYGICFMQKHACSFILNYFFILYFAYMYVFVRVSDSLELQLPTVVSCYICAWN